MAGTAQTPYGSYSYDFGGTHFLAVNAPTIGTIHPSTTAGAAHLAWIDADLAARQGRGRALDRRVHARRPVLEREERRVGGDRAHRARQHPAEVTA